MVLLVHPYNLPDVLAGPGAWAIAEERVVERIVCGWDCGDGGSPCTYSPVTVAASSAATALNVHRMVKHPYEFERYHHQDARPPSSSEYVVEAQPARGGPMEIRLATLDAAVKTFSWYVGLAAGTGKPITLRYAPAIPVPAPVHRRQWYARFWSPRRGLYDQTLCGSRQQAMWNLNTLPNDPDRIAWVEPLLPGCLTSYTDAPAPGVWWKVRSMPAGGHEVSDAGTVRYETWAEADTQAKRLRLEHDGDVTFWAEPLVVPVPSPQWVVRRWDQEQGQPVTFSPPVAAKREADDAVALLEKDERTWWSAPVWPKEKEAE